MIACSNFGKAERGDNQYEKNKILTTISTIMLFVPWTILPLRMFDWALESPVAEIMISLLCGVYDIQRSVTIISYVKEKVQNNLMKICLIVNGLYAVGGIAVFAMMVLPKIM